MSKINLSPINNLQNEATVTATINNNNKLISAAIDNSISRDGTQPNPMNSRLDMNSNQIINLPDAVSDQEPVTYGQFIEGITSVDNGAVIDGTFVVMSHDDSMLNDRVLSAGENIAVVDGGAKGNVEIRVSDPELNAIALTTSDVDKLPYFTGSGTADVTDFTPFARTLVDDIDNAAARATLGVVLGSDVQPHSALLDDFNSEATGIIAKTTANTVASRTVTGTSNEITVTNGDGVFGDPTVSLPNSLTFTGKTVSGGSFLSPAITTPTGIVKGDVGLGNVDNTSDATKNAAVATLTNKTLTSPVITTPTGIVKADVGLGNVDNTSDATKNAASATLTNKTISGSTNTLSNIANASLSSVADSTIKSNISGSSATPSDNTITAVLDKQLGTTQGTIAYRGASTWNALTPGTSGNFLKTNGASANPTWSAIPGGGDLLSTNNLSDVASAAASRANLGISDTLPTIQRFTAVGSGTYTTPAGCLWIRVRMVGGGGGGSGGGTGSPAGTSGGTSAFSGGTLSAGGGAAGVGSTAGGVGGSASGGNVVNIRGSNGTGASTSPGSCSGEGGTSTFGGAGSGAGNASPGSSAATNSGSGGGGGGGNVTQTGSGGGAGGYVEHIIPSPAASYTYTIGGGGSGGAAGTSGGAGGNGAAGIIIVEEYYR